MFHPFAVIESQEVDKSAQIGPFVVIHAGAKIGPGVIIHPHVVVEGGVEIGANTEVFPGAYLGKIPKGAGVLARKIFYKERLIVGADCSIGPHAVIYHDVEIQDGSLIGDAVSIREQTRIGAKCVIGRHVTINYNVIIGNRCKIMDHSWMAGNMVIGDDVFISGGVLTANDNSIAISEYDVDRVIGPNIEDKAQIGLGAKLMPGVRIGMGSVVGAAALVTRDVEPNTVVMGVPAKLSRRLGGAHEQS